MESRVKTVGDEISSLEGVDRRVEELADKISRLAKQLADVRVWHQDHTETETKLAVRNDKKKLVALGKPFKKKTAKVVNMVL